MVLSPEFLRSQSKSVARDPSGVENPDSPEEAGARYLAQPRLSSPPPNKIQVQSGGCARATVDAPEKIPASFQREWQSSKECRAKPRDHHIAWPVKCQQPVKRCLGAVFLQTKRPQNVRFLRNFSMFHQTLPAKKIFSCSTPSLRRFLIQLSVTNSKCEIASVNLRLISSGMLISKLCSPAFTCATATPSFAATNPACTPAPPLRPLHHLRGCQAWLPTPPPNLRPASVYQFLKKRLRHLSVVMPFRMNEPVLDPRVR